MAKAIKQGLGGGKPPMTFFPPFLSSQKEMGRRCGLRKPAGTSLEAVTRFRARGVTPAFFFPYSFDAKRIGPRPGRPYAGTGLGKPR